MIVLGIETSCDETAVGIVDDQRRIRADCLASQIALHAPYGGVVPEIAARAHLQHLDGLIRAALQQADLGWDALSGIAATCGPGLIGGVMIGAMAAKAMAAARNVPFSAVNHLAAHALTARLTDGVDFPYVLLLISGGHTQLLRVDHITHYRLLGTTLDDAVGECFDKAAKLLDLPYPGGPSLEALAMRGEPSRFVLPAPLVDRDGCDFSFSGLKTAVRQLRATLKTEQDKADLAAALQNVLARILAEKSRRALAACVWARPTALVAAGGVAANRTIRHALAKVAEEQGVPCVLPPTALCTDNGVMVAWAGLERLRLGLHDGLDTPARPRWHLDESQS